MVQQTFIKQVKIRCSRAKPIS